MSRQCDANSLDINRWLVRSGWALSFVRYSREYDADEQFAREAKAGLWSGAFIAPWDWRNRNSNTIVLGAISVPRNSQKFLLGRLDNPPDEHCRIKGNLSSKGGCIYHLPNGSYYNKLQMENLKGRRWFCNETEAQAAGCRRASR
jgi:hypothetical protein